jgi:hypothetical protein
MYDGYAVPFLSLDPYFEFYSTFAAVPLNS